VIGIGTPIGMSAAQPRLAAGGIPQELKSWRERMSGSATVVVAQRAATMRKKLCMLAEGGRQDVDAQGRWGEDEEGRSAHTYTLGKST
jgi:hypothetical protein